MTINKLHGNINVTLVKLDTDRYILTSATGMNGEDLTKSMAGVEAAIHVAKVNGVVHLHCANTRADARMPFKVFDLNTMPLSKVSEIVIGFVGGEQALLEAGKQVQLSPTLQIQRANRHSPDVLLLAGADATTPPPEFLEKAIALAKRSGATELIGINDQAKDQMVTIKVNSANAALVGLQSAKTPAEAGVAFATYASELKVSAFSPAMLDRLNKVPIGNEIDRATFVGSFALAIADGPKKQLIVENFSEAAKRLQAKQFAEFNDRITARTPAGKIEVHSPVHLNLKPVNLNAKPDLFAIIQGHILEVDKALPQQRFASNPSAESIKAIILTEEQPLRAYEKIAIAEGWRASAAPPITFIPPRKEFGDGVLVRAKIGHMLIDFLEGDNLKERLKQVKDAIIGIGIASKLLFQMHASLPRQSDANGQSLLVSRFTQILSEAAGSNPTLVSQIPKLAQEMAGDAKREENKYSALPVLPGDLSPIVQEIILGAEKSARLDEQTALNEGWITSAKPPIQFFPSVTQLDGRKPSATIAIGQESLSFYADDSAHEIFTRVEKAILGKTIINKLVNKQLEGLQAKREVDALDHVNSKIKAIGQIGASDAQIAKSFITAKTIDGFTAAPFTNKTDAGYIYLNAKGDASFRESKKGIDVLQVDEQSVASAMAVARLRWPEPIVLKIEGDKEYKAIAKAVAEQMGVTLRTQNSVFSQFAAGLSAMSSAITPKATTSSMPDSAPKAESEKPAATHVDENDNDSMSM